MTVVAAGHSDRGRVRPTNEDAYVVRVAAESTAALCVVADGMGGCNAGEVASRMAVEVIEEAAMAWLTAALDGVPGGDGGRPDLVNDAPEALARAVLSANHQVYTASREDPDKAGMGTTVTAAILAGGHLALAHVGDSRAFVIRAGGAAQVTADHSIVAELMRNGTLTEKEAEHHPHRNILTRALGTDPLVAVDLWQEQLYAGDIVVLCSDGVTRHVGREDLARLTRAAADPAETARAIVELANTRGGSDNLTVVVAIVGCSGD